MTWLLGAVGSPMLPSLSILHTSPPSTIQALCLRRREQFNSLLFIVVIIIVIENN
jgi:uncharacterized membrane protein YobD (UPF0266 family)